MNSEFQRKQRFERESRISILLMKRILNRLKGKIYRSESQDFENEERTPRT